MSAPPGSILPASFFDGLSQFWGAAAFVASSVAATGFVFSAATGRHDPIELIKLVTKLFFVGLATLFLRQWLMRLGDIIVAFDNFFGVDPSAVDDKYIHFLAGTTASKPDTSVWDVIWNTRSIGTAIAYALLWIFGWLAYGVQYIVNLIGGIFLTVGWALSPIFISFFMLRPMAGVGLKYITGLAAIVCWPFGWSIASVVTNAMLDAAATASLIPVIVPGGAAIAPILTVLLVGLWLIVSSALAPYVTWRILISGANPAAAFAQGVGGVAQGALAAGVGAATAAVTGGSSAGGVVAAAALGAMAGGTESAARGGGNPQTTGTAINGMAGFYRGQFARRQVEAMEEMAASNKRRADAAESFSAEFSDHFERRSEGQSGYSSQPHDSDPNQAAIDIEAHDKS